MGVDGACAHMVHVMTRRRLRRRGLRRGKTTNSRSVGGRVAVDLVMRQRRGWRVVVAF